jgi:hypothetical protein
MHGSIRFSCVAVCMAFAWATPSIAMASSGNTKSSTGSTTNDNKMDQRIDAMQKQIKALQQQLDALRQQQAAAGHKADKRQKLAEARAARMKEVAKQAAKSRQGIHFGGAMRFQYSYEDYSKGNVHRKGDAAFDIFRLNMRGKVDNIELQAEWRWFQYMSAVKYAWLGYDFTKDQQLQIGLTRIPFGNQPYDSHNYFFSSNYYLGLEDTYHLGVEYVYSGDPWNVQLAFFKNDGMGGVNGYVSNRSNSYSYDVVGVRAPGEGIYAAPQNPIGTANTVAARVAYTVKPTDDLKVEFGASGLHGNLESSTSTVGNYDAYALHMNAFYNRWNVQAEAAHYNYNVNGGAALMAVGAYAFYDSIAARADSYTFNVKYHQPVQWGPIHGLDFYNDYSLVTHKSGQLPSTFMNVLGVAVGAGDLYTYFDYVTARNQPFVGGSMAGDGGVEHRFNINFGFYF